MGRHKDRSPVILPYERPKVRVKATAAVEFQGEMVVAEVTLGPQSSDDIPIPDGFALKDVSLSHASASLPHHLAARQMVSRQGS